MKTSNRSTFFQEKNFLSFLVAVQDDAERESLLKTKLAELSSDYSLQKFNLDEVELKMIFEHLETSSLLGGVSIAWVDHVEKLTKKGLETIKEFGKNFPKNAYLLLGASSKTPLVDEEWLFCLDLLLEKPWDKEKRLKDLLLEMVRKNGKDIAPAALDHLLEHNDPEGLFLEQEIEKLICWTGERKNITLEDVQKISSHHKSLSIWQEAEQIVWEGKMGGSDPFALFPMIRSQLEMGLKIATLIEEGRSKEEWNQHLPKVYPRLLEKRASVAAKLRKGYFISGLKALFELELLSRSGSESPSALLTLLQAKLAHR